MERGKVWDEIAEQWASGIEVKETEVDKAMEVFRRGTAKRKGEHEEKS